MSEKITKTAKGTVVSHWDGSQKYWMANTEYAGIIVSRHQTDDEYVISDGVIEPGGFIPEHYHKWEDQTFHVLEGTLEARIGDETVTIGPGATVHCPRGVSHYMRNVGEIKAKMISYIFPGNWAEDYFAETARQNKSGDHDKTLIEERFGVVYL